MAIIPSASFGQLKVEQCTNAFYNASPINIGYDVTTSADYGNVVIEPASTLKIQNGSNGVTIKNGFECKKGARIIIE